MTVLSWVAVLVGVWCAVSVLAALGLGALLRRGAVVDGDLAEQGRDRDLAGPMAMWLAEIPHVPDTPAALIDDLPVQRRPRDVDSGMNEVPSAR
ncbi:hypothetical protein [Actinomycetospora sp. NBRC 106378]|jgi:hypothetical protein|uniref:hypothetical protein n=1 Tax=Actinomycetospora sp. NBRC 106378 TaxID=3032208 RepID=UPI0024A32763|nr:hypothetical protein [Actinomycetospora sp. NBRC 106378]GLZ56105.1 hypothetical protein Acsp07_57220 [Actinomycetospora sp. NBRC 106378]